MNPAHHLNRSRHYLNFTPANIAAGDYARATRALCRSVSHAVTAAAVHWHHRRDIRRRLRLFVKVPVFDGRLRCTHRPVPVKSNRQRSVAGGRGFAKSGMPLWPFLDSRLRRNDEYQTT